MKVKSLEIIADIEVGDADAAGLRVPRDEGQWSELRYNVECGSLFLEEGRLRLHVFVDRSSVEVLANEGRRSAGGCSRRKAATAWSSLRRALRRNCIR